MQEYVIGVDIGTGSTKAVALNKAGKVVASAQFYYTTNHPKPGYSEQDPEKIWDAFASCVKEISKELNNQPLVISLSSCMHSLIVIDKDGKAATSLITWADIRSEAIAEGIRTAPNAEDIYKATGTPIHSMSPLCKIMWLRENEPDVFEKAFKFISIKEFIWHRLFNVYEVDASIASATGLFNINSSEWDQTSLELCGIGTANLSKVVLTSFIRNDVNPVMASLLGIEATTNFCIGASDGCLANIGSYALEKGIAALTIGTSGAVRIASSRPLVNFSAMTFNYVLDESTFISGGPINNGGNVIKWLFKTFLNNADPDEKDYHHLFRTIQSVPAGSGGLVFLPYLHGERAPVWDEQASGMFFGIRAMHANEHFLKATVEGVCFALKNILELMEASTGSLVQLNVSGGFVNSPEWMQILADISGKKICLVQTEDASSIGAALLGMKAIRLINNYSSLDPGMDTVFFPDEKNRIVYERNYSVYKKLYEPLKKQMHELQKMNNE